MAPPATPIDYLRTNLQSDPVTNFLAYLDPSAAKNLISSAIGVSQDTKNIITKKVSDARDAAEKDPELGASIEKFRKATEDVKPYMAMGNPWKTPYVIDNLLHEWVKVKIALKHTVPVSFKDLDKATVKPAHYIMSDKVYDLVIKDAKIPEQLGDGQTFPRKIRFPENVPDTQMMLIVKTIIGEQIKSDFKALNDEGKKAIDDLMKSMGMEYISGTDEDTVVWIDGPKQDEAEIAFIEKNIRISREYAKMIDTAKSKLKEGESLAHRYVKILNKLKTRIKERDGAMGDGSENDGGKGEQKKSRYLEILKKAAKTAAGSKADEFIEVEPILPIFPKLKLKELANERPTPPTTSTTETTPGATPTVDHFLEFVKMPMPIKADVAGGGEKIRQLSYNKESILIFLRDNGLDVTDANDVKFAALVCKLVESKSIIPNDPSAVPAVANPDEAAAAVPVPGSLTHADVQRVISDGKLEIYAGYARRVLDASFYYASQGAVDGSLPWYESFQKVFGKVTVERRFITLCELVVASGCLRQYVCQLQVGSVLKANDVLKYRLIRISTPQLIFRALKMITNDFVFRLIDPLELREYYKFVKGGVLAQVAAGPLKGYLEGTIDPTEYEKVPDSYMIGDLMAIKEPPYFERIIKQAKIIFEVYGTNVGKWYQGERAIGTMDTQDVFFREIVRAIKVVDSERVKTIAEAIAANMNIGDLGDDKNVGAVKGFLMTVNLKELQSGDD